MADSAKLPALTGDDAHIGVRQLTTEQLRNLFRFAESVLPAGHPLKRQIDVILDKSGPPLLTVDAALSAEIYGTAVEVWREVESLKQEAARESARIVEGYRHTYIAKLDDALTLRVMAQHELNDLTDASDHLGLRDQPAAPRVALSGPSLLR